MVEASTARLPEELAARLQEVLKLSKPPRTLRELFSREDAEAWEIEGLFAEAPGRHAIGAATEERYPHCAMDGLYLLALGEAVELRSESPQSGAIVRARVVGAELEVSPREAVLSFGARKAEGPVRSVLCPFINLFTSEDEYGVWAAEHPEALMVAISAQEAFVLAREHTGRDQ